MASAAAAAEPASSSTQTQNTPTKPSPWAATDKRIDGRSAAQLRPFASELALLNRADGSARLVAGDSSVLAAVYGPKKPKSSRLERPDKGIVEVVVKAPSGITGPPEVEMAGIVQGVLEDVILTSAFPRTSVSVIVQIVSAAGSVLPLALNCVCLALMDAGVPMVSMFSASSCSVQQDGQLLLDPTTEEDEESVFSLTLCQRSDDSSGILALSLQGVCESDELATALGAAKKACTSVLVFLQYAMKQRVIRDHASTGLTLADPAQATAAAAGAAVDDESMES